jgi:MinD superfamily P-loop ATPase
MDLDVNVMTSEILDVDDIVDSHIHENLSNEEVNLIHSIPTKEDVMRHIEGLKSWHY